jgi:HSP20 family protein
MTEITRWNPFKELADFGSIFDRFLDRDLIPRRAETGLLGSRAWFPAVDILDQKDKLVVKADIPGIDKKDIKVKVEDDILTIKGMVKKDEETQEKDYYYRERAYGSFYRAITLPVSVQEDKVKANYANGILTIDLPKTKESKAKEITIE